MSTLISSESAERLCQNFIIPTIQSGKTRFTVNDGGDWPLGNGTFRDVLQSQAQPFVSWLNDFLKEDGHPHGNIDRYFLMSDNQPHKLPKVLILN